MSYYNAYGYILFSVIFFIGSLWIMKHNWKEILKKGLLITSICFLIAGWWFIRNAILYEGDFLGLKTETQYSEAYAMEKYKPSVRETPQNTGKTVWYMIKDMKWFLCTYYSFIGVFGYMSILIPGILYKMYFLFFVTAFIAALTGIKQLFWKERKTEQGKLKILLHYCFVGTIMIPIVLSLYYSYTSDFQPQGRYIMPMLIPFMYFMVYGVQRIMNRLIKNEKVKNGILMLMIVLLIIVCVYCLTRIVIPYYQK